MQNAIGATRKGATRKGATRIGDMLSTWTSPRAHVTRASLNITCPHCNANEGLIVPVGTREPQDAIGITTNARVNTRLTRRLQSHLVITRPKFVIHVNFQYYFFDIF